MSFRKHCEKCKNWKVCYSFISTSFKNERCQHKTPGVVKGTPRQNVGITKWYRKLTPHTPHMVDMMSMFDPDNCAYSSTYSWYDIDIGTPHSTFETDEKLKWMQPLKNFPLASSITRGVPTSISYEMCAKCAGSTSYIISYITNILISQLCYARPLLHLVFCVDRLYRPVIPVKIF